MISGLITKKTMKKSKNNCGPILSFVEIAQKQGWKYIPCVVVADDGRRKVNPEAVHLNNGTYATIVSPDGLVQFALDHTIVYYHNGNVWRGDPTDIRNDLIIIAAVVVDKNFRRKGYGTKAIKNFLEIANVLNMKVMLEACPIHQFSLKSKNITQKKLIQWYKKLGFVSAYPNQGDQILCYP